MSLISGNVTFGADAINCSSSSILGAAAFIDTASNQGTVSVASFSDTAVNEGTAASAVFSDGAVNVGSLTSGTFLGTAVNSGVVTVAEFFGTASNVGVIVEAAKFADTSSNVGTVSGSAIFADFSVSDGVVEGVVQLGVNVTEGENQALTETPTEYTQTDGYFPNAYYSSGVKAAPANYATVVHQVGSFWYKYDASGDGTLASGNYSDGTSLFTFTNGVKGAAYTPGFNVLGSYYYAGSLTSGTTVLYSDEALTTIADNITYIDAGVAKYTTNGSGVVTEEFISPIGASGYYYVGTFASGTTVLYSDNTLTAVANSITYSDGSNYYTTDGSGVVTEEVINQLGTSGYYYVGTLTSGTTVLYTSNALSTQVNSASTYVDAGVARYTVGNGGVVTIETIYPIGTSGYYYAGTFTSGTTLLYTSDALTTTANSIIPFVYASYYYTTNFSGVVTEQAVNTTGSYYHIGSFANGTTLYTDNNLTTLATSLTDSNVGDINSDGFDDFVSTDSGGVITMINYGTE